MPLSWALVIATKDRPEALETTVRLALEQTFPPSEVILVDASRRWSEHHARIGRVMAGYPGTRLCYQPAVRPSSATQRNQGIAQATADILFLIDDDSFLYPDCAEQVMQVYEADSEHTVAAVQLSAVATPPGDMPAAARHTFAEAGNIAKASPIKRWVYRSVLMFGTEAIFIPYDGFYPDRRPPEALESFDLRPARLIEGFRMTVRRAPAARAQFDSLLLYYCPGEDLDLSYRVSREGCLVTLPSARVFHFSSAGGRLKRRQIEMLWALNQAVFLRKHANDPVRARQRYIIKMMRRVLAEAIKDLGQGRFGLPKTRGVLTALRLSGRVFRASEAELADFYPALQERIVRET